MSLPLAAALLTLWTFGFVPRYDHWPLGWGWALLLGGSLAAVVGTAVGARRLALAGSVATFAAAVAPHFGMGTRATITGTPSFFDVGTVDLGAASLLPNLLLIAACLAMPRRPRRGPRVIAARLALGLLPAAASLLVLLPAPELIPASELAPPREIAPGVLVGGGYNYPAPWVYDAPIFMRAFGIVLALAIVITWFTAGAGRRQPLATGLVLASVAYPLVWTLMHQDFAPYSNLELRTPWWAYQMEYRLGLALLPLLLALALMRRAGRAAARTSAPPQRVVTAWSHMPSSPGPPAGTCSTIWTDLAALARSGCAQLERFGVQLAASRPHLPRGRGSPDRGRAARAPVPPRALGPAARRAVRRGRGMARGRRRSPRACASRREAHAAMLRAQRGRIAAVITATDWQSPSYLSRGPVLGGAFHRPGGAHVSDYKRDRHHDGAAYEREYLRQHLPEPPWAVHALMTACGMAAVTTVLAWLREEGALAGGVVAGRGVYHETRELLERALGRPPATVDETSGASPGRRNRPARSRAVVPRLHRQLEWGAGAGPRCRDPAPERDRARRLAGGGQQRRLTAQPAARPGAAAARAGCASWSWRA